MNKQTWYGDNERLKSITRDLRKAKRELYELSKAPQYEPGGKKIDYLAAATLPNRIAILEWEYAFVHNRLCEADPACDEQVTVRKLEDVLRDGGPNTSCDAYNCTNNVLDPGPFDCNKLCAQTVYGCNQGNLVFDCEKCTCVPEPLPPLPGDTTPPPPCIDGNCEGIFGFDPTTICWKIQLDTEPGKEEKFLTGGFDCETCSCTETEPPFDKSFIGKFGENWWDSVKFVDSADLRRILYPDGNEPSLLSTPIPDTTQL